MNVLPPKPTLLLITLNSRLVAQFNQISTLLDYELIHLSNITEASSIVHASLVIVDIINHLHPTLYEQFDVLPLSVPSLWIMGREPDEPRPAHVLVNPFRVTDAVHAVQRALRSHSYFGTNATEALAFHLLNVSSAENVLEVMSSHIIRILAVQRVGVLISGISPLRSIFWLDKPDESTHERVVSACLHTSPMPAGWYRAPFMCGPYVGFVVVESARPLAATHTNLLMDVAALSARIWMREVMQLETTQRIKDTQIFDVVARAMIAQRDVDKVCGLIVQTAAFILPMDALIVLLVREDELVAVEHSGQRVPDRDRLPLNHPVFVELLDATQPCQLAEPSGLFAADAVAQEFFVALKTEGASLGGLLVGRRSDDPITEDEYWRLRTFATWCATAILNARMHNDVQASLHRERAYRERLVQNEKLSALGRLASSVAHEVNNLLQVLQSSLDMMKKQPPLLTLLEHLEVMQDSIDQIVSVIAGIQNTYISRTNQPYVVEVNPLLLETARMIKYRAGEKSITLRYRLADTLPTVMCVPQELRQVFLNILLNAVDAILGEGTITLQTQYAPSTHEVTIAIEDTGVGIDSDIMDSVFEPFFTTKANGSGLGLAISREIMRSFGGRISVTSKLAEGSRFVICLPATGKQGELIP